MSTARIFTALLAAGAALADPVAKPEAEAEADALADTVDLGPGIPTSSGITITTLSYYGDGCPKGGLTGEYFPETSSFNVSIKDLKAILQDGQDSDASSCYIEVGFKTEAQVQLNLLQGDFHGAVYLEEAGMTALAHSSVSFAGNAANSNIPWLWRGPVDAKAIYEHTLLNVFVSQCSAGGDFLMLIDLVLHVTRGPASSNAVGFIDIDELTGALSQAYVLQPSPCGKTVDSKPPKSESSQSGGGYGREEATKKETTEKKTASASGVGHDYGYGLYRPGISKDGEKKLLAGMSESDKQSFQSENSYKVDLKLKYKRGPNGDGEEAKKHHPRDVPDKDTAPGARKGYDGGDDPH